MVKSKMGRPKKIDGRMVISHGIPIKLLNEVDTLAKGFELTRTEIINQFIIDGLKKGKV